MVFFSQCLYRDTTNVSWKLSRQFCGCFSRGTRWRAGVVLLPCGQTVHGRHHPPVGDHKASALVLHPVSLGNLDGRHVGPRVGRRLPAPDDALPWTQLACNTSAEGSKNDASVCVLANSPSERSPAKTTPTATSVLSDGMLELQLTEPHSWVALKAFGERKWESILLLLSLSGNTYRKTGKRRL